MSPEKSQKPGCLGFVFRLFGVVPDEGANESRAAAAEEALPWRKKDWLFSKAERSFFGVLQGVVGERWLIFAKVRLSDLVWMPRDTPGRQGHTNRVDRKHVDFVLCDRDTVAPVLVIELDDASHKGERRQQRDQLVDRVLSAAGLPILHVPAQQAYNTSEVRASIEAVLGPAGS